MQQTAAAARQTLQTLHVYRVRTGTLPGSTLRRSPSVNAQRDKLVGKGLLDCTCEADNSSSRGIILQQ